MKSQIALVTALSLTGPVAWTQTQSTVEYSLVGPDFLRAVALHEDTLVVRQGETSAWVYVHERTAGGWSQTRVVPMPIVCCAYSGDLAVNWANTLALDVDRVVGGNPHGGVAQVSRRIGGVFGTPSVLSPSGGPGGDERFGCAVATGGNVVVVGAYLSGGSGAAYVFELQGTNWVQSARLVSFGPGSTSRTGYAVACDGDRIVLTSNSGALADTFVRNGSTWVHEQTLPPIGLFTQGDAVALDGDTLILGVPTAALVYRLGGGGWTLETTIQNPSPATLFGFGSSVALREDRAVIGSPFGYFPNPAAGRAYVHQRTGSAWSALGHFNPQPVGADGAGSSVAADGESIALLARSTNRVSVVRVFGSLGNTICIGDTACPCANGTAAVFREGCANSTGHGALLTATGTASVGANDLRFEARHLPPGVTSILAQGTVAAGASAGVPFRDGKLCVTGTVARLQSAAAAGDGRATYGPGLGALGAWVPGQTLVFQSWYRNAIGPCGTGSNLTQGLSVTFGP